MSEYVTKEMLEEARKMDLLTYLKNYEPYELVKVSGDTYTTKKHDSVRINNGLWHRFSTNTGGKSAIDYLIKVEGYTLPQAVKRVLNKSEISPPRYIKQEIIDGLIYDTNLSKKEINAILSCKKPLQKMYEDWLTQDGNLRADLNFSIDKSVNSLTNAYIKKVKNTIENAR